MSLATRCTACGTVFRVVQDQLKVSEGWVRCGRCTEVFNALEGLFDLERDMPQDWPAGTPAQAPPGIVDGTTAVPQATEIEAMPENPSLVDKIDAQLMVARDEHGATPAISARDRLEFPDAQFDPDMLADEAAPAGDEPGAAPSATDTDAEVEQPLAAPEFVQRARRQARWQSPGMRALQAVAAAVLLALLGLQAVHHDRDAIAARWPAVAPALAAWCAAWSCTLDAPRHIEDVAVESTALTRANAPDAFKLAVVLRNRGATAVALPAIDLSLTDTNGQLVARRVLAPRDFRVVSAPLKPGAESALQLMLTAGGARVAGYTVEVFYP